MVLKSEDIRSRLEAACAAAREAGEITLRYFQDRGLHVDRKPDGSPVTDADREAESHLRRAIAAQFPEDAIVGEEFDAAPGKSPFRWVLDPIDGTVSFVCGVPLFGTMIGIELEGRPVAGVIEMPAMRERVFGGLGLGAWHQVADSVVRSARVSSVPRLRDSVVCSTSLDYFVASGCAPLYGRLQVASRALRGWSDCYAFVLLTTGRVEAVVEPKVHPWDVSAAAAIIPAAGGRITDFDGSSDHGAPHCAATNGHVHEELMALTRSRATGA